MQSPRPIPVRPAYPPKNPQNLLRACFAAVRAAALNERNPVSTARSLFGDDEIPALILQRAAVGGAVTTVPAWAGLLVTSAVGDFLTGLTPASAAAALIARGIAVSVTEGVPLNIPLRAAAPTAFGYVGEGSPIPLRAWSFTTAAVDPRKMAVLVVMTKELARISDAPRIFEAMLMEEAALSLDTAYFSTAAGSASAHAGLLNGVTPLTATTGGGSAAMVGDLTKLASAVSAGGSGQVVFVTGPGRAAATAMRTADITATILPSLAVAEDRVIAVDPISLVHGFGGTPEITTTEEALLHMESVPLQIATGAQGSGVLATPSQSMFQTGQIAMRMLLDIAFAKRRTGAVAYIDAVTW